MLMGMKKNEKTEKIEKKESIMTPTNRLEHITAVPLEEMYLGKDEQIQEIDTNTAVIVEEVREETPSPSPSGRNSPINGMKKGIDDSTTRSGSGKKSTGYAGARKPPGGLALKRSLSNSSSGNGKAKGSAGGNRTPGGKLIKEKVVIGAGEAWKGQAGKSPAGSRIGSRVNSRNNSPRGSSSNGDGIGTNGINGNENESSPVLERGLSNMFG